MAKPLALQQIRELLSPGMRVLLHGGPSECLALRTVLQDEPDIARAITVVSLLIPGINTFDYASLTDSTRLESLFLTPALRPGFDSGRLDLKSMHYSAFPGYLRRNPVDLAILHLPPPRNGAFSCGLTADIAANASAYARRVAVICNHQMPRTHGARAVRTGDVDALFEIDAPLLAPAAEPTDPALAPLAANVAALIDDGDTLQFGIGRMAAAVLGQLGQRRRLRIHSGMILDEVAPLLEVGAIDAPIITGIAVGTPTLLNLARSKAVAFHGIDETHNIHRLAELNRFTAINAAVEVDLFGRINSEYIGPRQISGIGGSGDFLRGAQLSHGGRSIIALPSQSRGRSRIVPCLPTGTTSHGRAEIDILVTEHGAAHLRDLGLDARAEMIIALAAPEHRTALADSWRTVRANL